MAAILDITAIEQAVEARLVQMIPVLAKTAIQRDGRYIFNNPAVTVSIYETGTWVKQGKANYLVPCTLTIQLIVTNANSEEARRRDINPLVFSIILALAQQKLGLDLEDPGIEPEKFQDATTDEEWKQNKIVYVLQFGLRFAFRVPANDAEAADLIGIAVDYLLEPGDDLPDAQDELTP